jgi:hypothetical protein
VICSDFTKNNLALRKAFCEQFGAERVKCLHIYIAGYPANREHMQNYEKNSLQGNIREFVKNKHIREFHQGESIKPWM